MLLRARGQCFFVNGFTSPSLPDGVVGASFLPCGDVWRTGESRTITLLFAFTGTLFAVKAKPSLRKTTLTGARDGATLAFTGVRPTTSPSTTTVAPCGTESKNISTPF